jgi:hypothetical protein
MNDNIKAGSDIHAGDGGYSEGTQEEYEKFVKVRNQSLNKARIKEFEKQSGLEIFGLGARRDIWEATVKKFTELIVRECIDVVAKATASPNGYQALMKHFGVEK